MAVIRTETKEVRTEEDVVRIRHAVRAKMAELQFGLVDQTKMVTAASELARNTVIHGNGGTCALEIVEDGGRRGLRLTFADSGPGIVDLDLAMRDGYTTGNGLGLGLGGSKRLVNDFQIFSRPGEGTRIIVTRWK